MHIARWWGVSRKYAPPVGHVPFARRSLHIGARDCDGGLRTGEKKTRGTGRSGMELRAGTGVFAPAHRPNQSPRPEDPFLGLVFVVRLRNEPSGRKYGPIVGLGPRPTPSPGVDATGWDGDPRTGWQEAYGIGLSGVEIHARYGVLCHRITWAPPRPEVPIRGSSFHCSSQERAVTREYGPLAGLRPRPAPTRTSTPRATTTALGSGGKTPTASAFPGWKFLLRLGFCPSGSGSLSPRPEGPFLGLIFVFRLKNEAWHENTAHQQVFVRCPHRAPALTPWGATAAHGPGPETPMESAFPRWQFVP